MSGILVPVVKDVNVTAVLKALDSYDGCCDCEMALCDCDVVYRGVWLCEKREITQDIT